MAAGERREDFMNRSLDEIAAEMDSSLYDRDDREGHHRQGPHRYSPYPADHVPSWRSEKEGGGGANGGNGGAGNGSGGDGSRVFIANLSYTVTWQKIKDLLKTGWWCALFRRKYPPYYSLWSRAVGPVLKCDLFRNADGSSRVSSNLQNNKIPLFHSSILQGMGWVSFTRENFCFFWNFVNNLLWVLLWKEMLSCVVWFVCLFVCCGCRGSLVLFADSESADCAVRELNGTELEGRKIFLRKVGFFSLLLLLLPSFSSHLHHHLISHCVQ